MERCVLSEDVPFLQLRQRSEMCDSRRNNHVLLSGIKLLQRCKNSSEHYQQCNRPSYRRSRLKRDKEPGLLMSAFFTFLILSCFMNSMKILPVTSAEKICGAKLVDVLRALCGKRGIYNPVIKVGPSGTPSTNLQEDISVVCCEKSCSREQLVQYCGKPVLTSKQRRLKHMMHLVSILPYGHNRRRGRTHTRRVPVASRADSRETRPRQSPLTRSSRHIIIENYWERYQNMSLHQILRAYDAGELKNYATHGQSEGGIMERLGGLKQSIGQS